jgi:hypothetical protein
MNIVEHCIFEIKHYNKVSLVLPPELGLHHRFSTAPGHTTLAALNRPSLPTWPCRSTTSSTVPTPLSTRLGSSAPFVQLSRSTITTGCLSHRSTLPPVSLATGPSDAVSLQRPKPLTLPTYSSRTRPSTVSLSSSSSTATTTWRFSSQSSTSTSCTTAQFVNQVTIPPTDLKRSAPTSLPSISTRCCTRSVSSSGHC